MSHITSRFLMLFLLCIGLSAYSAESGQVETIAQQIVDDLNQGTGAVFTQYMDSDSVMRRAMADLPKSKQTREFFAGFQKGTANLGSMLQQKIAKPGYAYLVRVQKTRAGANALVRLDQGDQGFAYLDLMFKESKQGLKIIDFKNYATGDLFSDTARNSYALFTSNSGVLEKLFGKISGDDSQKIIDLVKAKKDKNHDLFFAVYDDLKEETRADRLICVLATSTALEIGDEDRYAKTMDTLAQYHGDDPGMKFLLVDYHFLRQDYAKALSVLEEFHAYLGVKDAGLLALQANAAIFANKVDQGIAFAMASNELEPELETPYWALLLGYATKGQFNKAIAPLQKLEQKYGYVLDARALSGSPAYEKLANSEAYENWLASK